MLTADDAAMLIFSVRGQPPPNRDLPHHNQFRGPRGIIRRSA
jgi:hypothetical protein